MNESPSSPKVSPFLAIVFLFVSLLFLAWGILPMFSGGGPTKRMKVINNLVAIDMVKQMWASDHGVTGSAQVVEHDLMPYFHRTSASNDLVKPVMGERYVINPLGVAPEAHLTRNYGKWPPGTIIRYIRNPGEQSREEIILPNQQGGANGNQPIRLETNSMSSAAGSRRSP